MSTKRNDGRKMPIVETTEPQKSSNEITDEGCCNHNWSRAYHADGNRDQELALIEPAELLNEALLEKRHDDETAAEGERAGLEKKQQELSED